MTSTKKLIVAIMLGITVAAGLGNVAKASTSWNYGLYDGHNGYYMAYGYYYDSAKSHYSWATLGGHSSGNCSAPAGQTSLANSPSEASTSWDAGHSN